MLSGKKHDINQTLMLSITAVIFAYSIIILVKVALTSSKDYLWPIKRSWFSDSAQMAKGSK